MLFCIVLYCYIMNKKTTAKRIFARIGISILSLFVISVISGAVILISTSRKIDYSSDVELFSMSRGSKTTKIYCNAPENSSISETLNIGRRVYIPKELENERVFGAENGIWCTYDNIPQNLKNAFIAIEDRRFFEHKGVDWLRTGKAVANYVFDFDSRFGGSTITQQLIKNISNDKEISASRKLREILRAINIEKNFTKEEILELYLNIIPMSENCVGVGSAAETYFGKTVEKLTLVECVCLAAITNSPTRYNPISNPEDNLARRNLILSEMKVQGYISDEDFAIAYNAPLEVLNKKDKKQAPHSWYTEAVLADVISDLMETKGYSYEVAYRTVYSGGLKIYTLMDERVQGILDTYFSNEWNFPYECRARGMQMAMTVIDTKTGDLLGVVGAVGAKEADRVLSYATEAKMPPGSSIKPLSVYGPALQEGLITWGTVIDDTPVSFYGKTPWPNNYPAIYSGLTDINTALTLSKNTVAIKVYSMLGAERSYSYLVNKLGVRSIVRSAYENGNKVTDLASAPLALGQLSYGATLREMTSAYTSFYDGNHRECRSYIAVYDSLGNLILENEAQEERVWSEQNASIMTQMLQNVTSHGTAKDITLKYTVDTAGKTGTSGEDRDRWFIGYTPYYTAGIWCGYPDRDNSIGEIKKTHLDVWDEVMKKVHNVVTSDTTRQIEDFRIADGVIQCTYCKDSGKIHTSTCECDPRGNRMGVGYFASGTAPRNICNSHVLVDYDVDSGGVVDLSKDEEKEYYSLAENKDKLKKIALVKEYNRSFPHQIYITDAEYIYRAIEKEPTQKSWSLPFFADTITKGKYVGITYKKDGKQFNAFCFEHKQDEELDYEDIEELQGKDDEANEKEPQSTGEKETKDEIGKKDKTEMFESEFFEDE